jgi:hypothetical protein
VDLTDNYRLFHPRAAQCTFFSASHGMLSKTNYILGHKPSLNKYKEIKIMPVFYQTTMQ